MYCPVTRQPSKDCPHSCCKPSENDEPVFNRLLIGQIGSCGCMVKTPEHKYHHPLCHFRLLDEAAWEIQRLKQPHEPAETPVQRKARQMIQNAFTLRDHFTYCEKTMGDSHPCTCGMDAYAKLLRELDQPPTKDEQHG
jgi:hypothetical protein